jgi:glucose/mannose-6-phosphate isomerase
MLEAAAGLPEQIEEAVTTATGVTGLPDHDDIENVVVLGMGGSGIAGDVCAAIAGPFMPVPVVVQKGYAPPQFVNESSLVFAVSCSGNTEETIEAASMAAMAGARMVVVCAGGELAAMAEEWDAPHIPVPTSIPQPRAAIGALSIPPLVVLESVGLFPGATGWISAAVDQLKVRRDALVRDGNDAEVLARRIGHFLPLIYGGGTIGSVAAMRWKTQFNENAKVASFWNTIPELTHNEVCGWGQHGDVTRQVFRLINLRHEYEHPQIARRFALIAEAVDEVVGDIDEVWAQGDGALAQMLDLILFGDFVTLHSALQAGVDPGPVAILSEIKAKLAQDR